MSTREHRMARLTAVLVALVLSLSAWPGAAAAAIEGTNGAPVPELEWGACPASSPEDEVPPAYPARR
jgi:hypothetical protein